MNTQSLVHASLANGQKQRLLKQICSFRGRVCFQVDVDLPFAFQIRAAVLQMHLTLSSASLQELTALAQLTIPEQTDEIKGSTRHSKEAFEKLSMKAKMTGTSHKCIDLVLFAYRTSRQDCSKYTPFYLKYGSQATLPIDILTDQQKTAPSYQLRSIDDR